MINLLPPKEKRALLKEKRFKEILILEIVVLFTFACLTAILLGIKIDLQSKVSFQKTILQQKKGEFEASDIKNLEKKLESLNKLLTDLNSVYQNQFYFTDILEDFSKNIPPGLYLNTLSFEKTKGEIAISGFAPSRDILTEFKKNLEKDKNFKDVVFPPSSWITPVDIKFSINFKITK